MGHYTDQNPGTVLFALFSFKLTVSLKLKPAVYSYTISFAVVKRGGPETPFLTSLQRFAAARKALGAPNPAWFLAVPAVQVSTTVLVIGRPSLSRVISFDTNGTLDVI